jgi:multidrug efflux pump subunit AcrA (membrane-fusion protein)
MAGRLREVSPMADPVTRTFAARISLQDADPLLPLGMTATVRFPNGTGGRTGAGRAADGDLPAGQSAGGVDSRR